MASQGGGRGVLLYSSASLSKSSLEGAVSLSLVDGNCSAMHADLSALVPDFSPDWVSTAISCTCLVYAVRCTCINSTLKSLLYTTRVLYLLPDILQKPMLFLESDGLSRVKTGQGYFQSPEPRTSILKRGVWTWKQQPGPLVINRGLQNQPWRSLKQAGQPSS